MATKSCHAIEVENLQMKPKLNMELLSANFLGIAMNNSMDMFHSAVHQNIMRRMLFWG